MPDPDKIPIVNSFVQAGSFAERNQIPIFGDVWRGTNGVIDFVEYGCFPHWQVWLDTLWEPLGDLFLELLDFGLGDILRGYFRPNQVRGFGGITRFPDRKKPPAPNRRRPPKGFPKFPEIGNEIGKKLPGAEFFAGRKVTGLERWFWQIDMLVQRFLWYWLVADLSADFIVNWTTAIMESEACQKPRGGGVRAVMPSDQILAGDNWSAITNWNVLQEDPPGCFTSGIITPPTGMKTAVSFSADLKAGFPTMGSGLSLGVGSEFNPNAKETPWPVDSRDDPDIPGIVGVFTPGPSLVLRAFPHDCDLGWVGNGTVTATFEPV